MVTLNGLTTYCWICLETFVSVHKAQTCGISLRKKLCAVSVGKGNTEVNYQPQGRQDKLATVKDSKTDVSSFRSSSESTSIHSDEGLKLEMPQYSTKHNPQVKIPYTMSCAIAAVCENPGSSSVQ